MLSGFDCDAIALDKNWLAVSPVDASISDAGISIPTFIGVTG